MSDFFDWVESARKIYDDNPYDQTKWVPALDVILAAESKMRRALQAVYDAAPYDVRDDIIAYIEAELTTREIPK